MLFLDDVQFNTEHINIFINGFNIKNIDIVIASEKRKPMYWMLNEYYQTLPFPGHNIFRAWSSHDEKSIVIFKDEVETEESLIWLLIHELTHLEIRLAPWLLIYSGLFYEAENIRKNLNVSLHDYCQMIRENDDLHENDPEEKLCNYVATTLVGKSYDRHWWRERKK